MLSVEECRKYLKNIDITDQQVLGVRDALVTLISELQEQYDGSR